jgi:hypothetical protein
MKIRNAILTCGCVGLVYASLALAGTTEPTTQRQRDSRLCSPLRELQRCFDACHHRRTCRPLSLME